MFKFDEKIQFIDRKNDILAVGELLIDMISVDYNDNFECNIYNKFFGGSPSNIAMNVKKLGISSIVAAAVGRDGLGKFLINHLDNAKVDTTCIQLTNYSTSMVLVTKSKGSPVPIFYRQADYQLEYTIKIEEALKNSKILHFSCWAISMVPVRNTIEKLIEEARKKDILVCFDPNYHSMIWKKGENGIEYIKSLISKVDIVKPSEDDAERLFGKDIVENQVAKFLKLGAKLVIMTLGKDGAIVSNGSETIKLNTRATDVIDTTGAGDAFWAGFYTAIIKGYTLRESLNLGLAVSAYKLKYNGAVIDLPTLEVLKKMNSL